MDKKIAPTLVNSSVGRDGEFWYDTTRLTEQQLREQRVWSRPNLPDMTANGYFLIRPISEQLRNRIEQLHESGDTNALQLMRNMEQSNGYAKVSDLCQSPEDEHALADLMSRNVLKRSGDWVYDPLRLGSETMQEIARQEQLIPLRQEVTQHLESQSGKTALQTDLREKFGKDILNDMLVSGLIMSFTIAIEKHPLTSWVRLRESNHREAEQAARDTLKQIAEEARAHEEAQWLALLGECGDVVREDAREGKTGRMQVISRTYTIANAAKKLGVREHTLEDAIREDVITPVIDPERTPRVPAYKVEMALTDPEYHEQITAYETLTARDISIVCDVTYPTVRRRLQRVGIKRAPPRWGEIRGKWTLPDTLAEFYTIRKQKLDEWRAERDAERLEQERQIVEQRRQEREQRDALRARLVAAFPTWQHIGRSDQRIHLHVGPPNSGKTHEALNALAEAESGWYLAPLRLLAYEIFDRMNQRGVRCNLLTGEEYIPVEGATITAATVEMFDPTRSGECVIIDEAQLLADPDRGWAWTRAMMEALAPNIHIIGPQTAKGLIQHLAGAAAVPVTVIEHERLAPIQVAEKHWPLAELPPRTILV
ncbi:MAG: hypothetical protein H7175_23890, partial [Burkholderiales bacterium]|nr:hypothetical protein [Anaerolineae bacterium]